MTDPDETVAYPRQHPRGTPQWRTDVERFLNRLDDFYCALWDLMPPIVATLTLVVLLIVVPRR